nr:hypothetical protein [Tanacetum cinerariifolium]
MSFSKHSDNASVCYTKPLDFLKNWNDYFFWVDDFACPASFLWHTAKHVIRDPAPVAADFNKQDYATLVVYPSPFRKFPKAFLYLVGLSRHCTLDEETYLDFCIRTKRVEMDIFAFIHTLDPSKVKIIERECNEGEPLLLETTIGRTVPLLPVAPDRDESELDASVERLFDEGGSGNQTEQVNYASGGKDADIQPVFEDADTVVEDVAHVQLKRQGKRKSVVVDAGKASHPPEKLREDYGTLSGTFVNGKSRSALKRLLDGAVLNAEVGVAAMAILPFMIASISSTTKREGGDHTDFVVGPNLWAIGTPLRFVISSDSSHHSGTNVAEAEVDSLIRSFVLIMTNVTTITPTVDHALVTKKKLVKPSSFCIDSSSAGGIDPTRVSSWILLAVTFFRVCRDMVDEFAPPKFFASIRRMEHDQLFTEFNVGAARQMSLSVKVKMRAEYNVKEKRRLKFVDESQVELLKVREGEIENLKAQLLLREAEAAEAIRLRAQASNFKIVEKFLRDKTNALNERNAILKKERNALDVKVRELEASTVGKELELTGLNALIHSVRSQNDILVDGVHELEISSSGLREKVTVWLLTHGMELAIVKFLNSPEYLSALEAAIGKANEKGMIRENVANQRSALCDVFASLAEPFFAAVLTGAEGTSDIIPSTANTNTAMSTTFASTSFIAHISVYDYEVVGTEDQAVADENATLFPNVDVAELNIPQ